MLRKLRRLRVPVCFYTCCSLCAILLFVSFNEDVKSLIQQNHVNRGGGSSGSGSQNLPPSFSSFSSSSSALQKSSNYAASGNIRLISSVASGGESTGGDVNPSTHQSLRDREFRNNHYQHHRSNHESPRDREAILPVEPTFTEKQDGEDGDGVIRKYIDDNFVGRRAHEKVAAVTDGTPQQPTPQQQNTNVISNLVKLAQQASNNPNAFSNINSLTGEETVGGDDFQQHQGFVEEHLGTTSDTDMLYPGGDATSMVRKRERQWFMTGGDYFPTPPGGLASIFYPSVPWLASKPSTAEYPNLWYDGTDGSDRVIDQLMFALDDPINYSNISWGFESGPTATTTGKPPITNNELDGDKVDPTDGGGGDTGAPVAHANSAVIPSSQFLLPPSTSGGHHNYGGGSSSFAPSGSSTSRDPRLGKIKTILLYYGLGMSWGSHITNGRQVFLQQKCPVNACRLTGNRAQLSKADIVVFKDVFMHPKIRRPPNQLWVMYMLECPLNTQNFLEKNAFNLTATYRHDSDIVTPYEKWVYFDETVRSLPQAINYAEGKTKKVAWFVSNCVAKNNRLEFARELAKYIEVDIYGACGSHTCSRANARQCFEMLSKNYKFYLAFENSNCRDYISEKFFVNGLGNNVLPIVMGAHPDDYKRVSPDRSYIHVDDFSSPKELAQYLHELDANDDLYNEYFKWKGTGEFINTHFFCRLCAMAHYATRFPKTPSHYDDFNRWWRGPHVCTRQSWRSTPDIFASENYDTIISTNHK